MSELIDYVTSNWDLIVQRTVEHLVLSGWSMLIALVVALPLALWLGHTGKGAFIAINSSNIGRALPSLGLLAIFASIPAFGLSDRATIAALAALAIPPILTNAYVGIRETDRDVVEAARGMGLTEAAILGQVELPLAAPVIMAGIRTAASQVVATATLAAWIAGGGLGRFIFDGFAVGDNAQILTGAIAVALLTVLTELLFGLAERAATPKGLTVGRAGGEGRRVRPGPTTVVTEA
jgi:osmoprotectant transport system permease protein